MTRCPNCEQEVEPVEIESTYCGSMCPHCFAGHAATCGVCRKDFLARELIDEEDLTSMICDLACGYVDGFERALAEYELDVEELEELLLDNNIEKCPTCEWFVDAAERIPDGSDDPDDYCENCRPKRTEE